MGGGAAALIGTPSLFFPPSLLDGLRNESRKGGKYDGEAVISDPAEANSLFLLVSVLAPMLLIQHHALLSSLMLIFGASG